MQSKHPLFVRLGQRDEIFMTGNPNSLSLDSESKGSFENFIALFKKTPEEQLAEFVAKDSKHPGSFVELLGSRTAPEALSLLCAFIDRLLDLEFNDVIGSLMPYSKSLSEYCARILISHTADHTSHPFLVRTVLLLLGTIISEVNTEATDESFQTYTRTALTLLSSKLPQASIALEGLKRALRSEAFRVAFIADSGIGLLLELLSQSIKANNNDALYHILFCIWGLTYTPDGAGQLAEGDFVNQLARLLATVQPEREELVRLLAMIVQQLNPSTVFIEAAYDNDMLKLLRTLQAKHYVDTELNGTLQQAADAMCAGLKHLSLWDKYVREVKSGRLKNSLSHRSDLFWKANIERFGEHNFAVLTLLRDLLRSDDEETVAVACHDLGEYVDRHPLGRVKLEEIQAKEAVMQLLTSKSAAIQQEALRTTQLLLLRTAGN